MAESDPPVLSPDVAVLTQLMRQQMETAATREQHLTQLMERTLRSISQPPPPQRPPQPHRQAYLRRDQFRSIALCYLPLPLSQSLPHGKVFGRTTPGASTWIPRTMPPEWQRFVSVWTRTSGDFFVRAQFLWLTTTMTTISSRLYRHTFAASGTLCWTGSPSTPTNSSMESPSITT